MEDGIGGLRHMLATVFLSAFAGFMVVPVITDVTVAAVCSGPDDSCSLAVYLTGFQQVAIGMGTMIMMPVIGNLSDRYGIKTILTLPMCLSIVPPVILGYRRDIKFFYVFYISKILTSMVCEGTVDCLAYAYVAVNIHGSTRISAFGILAGIKTIAGLFGTLVARFLPIALTFQVSAISFFVGLVYMRVFLKEKLNDDEDDDLHHGTYHQEDHDSINTTMLAEPILNDRPIKTQVFHKKYSSLKDMISLMKTSTIFFQALVVTFFSSFSDSGMESAFLYFLKARFGFDKKQFADLLLLITIVGSISQLFVLPRFASAIGECKLLSTGLFMEFINMAIVSISWAPWVPYLTTVFVPGALFVMPSVCGIASRQVGPGEQGKVQGCISGVRSFGKVVAPFVFSPLTALFLSKNAPFYFPGFSLLCISLSSVYMNISSIKTNFDLIVYEL
ncbi:Major facilitator superfamily protein [Arabidopsis thaliana]|uniref:Major facilitator superfamily protein n=1 Tax=Arabidopsis thaliana TaxID=3702 RepID=A0A1P8AXG6_ARATH|nr:Major facilitator superfamily protein [Arabidopsis thaliana]ANM61356.1 Major facilitator superfamily protein [Arabidopsis thaliana]|eukprot:NP_001323579.1 Major facilitator superfamily protein [Arabidopsis thaliana]